jgi:acyl-CoA synthetase (AMP-forming)/AMP-acid ligase II
MSEARRRNISVFLDHQVEQGRADHTAVICGDERVTYGELLALACRVAAALRDSGVRREERVLLPSTTPPRFPPRYSVIS